MSHYVPAPGDLVWLEFTPQAGHEQAGRRPALVVSAKDYNRKTGLALFCPVTSKIKAYPFEVRLIGKAINGVILSDQIKSLDWRTRKAERIGPAPAGVLEETLAKIRALLPVAG